MRGNCNESPDKYATIRKRRFFGDHLHLYINLSGMFIGGPQGDADLTGRKIIIDTYRGWGAQGGGAFSGKDPTKVDRSEAHACRQVAKSVMKPGLCESATVLRWT